MTAKVSVAMSETGCDRQRLSKIYPHAKITTEQFPVEYPTFVTAETGGSRLLHDMIGRCLKRGLLFIVVSGAVLAALVAHFSPSVAPLLVPVNTYWGPQTVPKGELP